MRSIGWYVCMAIILGVFILTGGQVYAQSPDTVVVDSVAAYAGDSGIRVPVYGWVGSVGGEDLDAVNFGLSYDTSALVCKSILYDVSDAGELCFYDSIPSPFIKQGNCYVDSGWATMGIVFSMVGDDDIPPGHYRMFDIVFDVKAGAAPGCYVLHIDDAAGLPPIGNYFTHNITVEYFEKVDGKLCVVEEQYGSISGTVTSAANGIQIDGAQVIAGDFSSTTNGLGKYRIDSLPVGTYDVIAKGPACVPDTIKDVTVEESPVTEVNFEVTPLDSIFLPDAVIVKANVEFKIPVWGRISGVESGDSLLDLDAITFTVEYDARLVVDSVLYTCDSIFYDSTVVYSQDGEVISGYAMELPRLCEIISESELGMWSPNIHNSEGWTRVGVIFDLYGYNDISPGRYHFFDFKCHLVDDGIAHFGIGDGIGSPPMPILFTYHTVNSHPYYDEDCLTPVTMEGKDEKLPTEHLLFQNYPNPFNMETRIRYHLPNYAEVELGVYNLLGERVKTLVDQAQKPGSYSISWDGTNMGDKPVSSGIYFYRLKTGNYAQVKRMLLLK